MRNTFDSIVVGGGTAGCVLASRLSSESSRNVVLIEAGHDDLGALQRAESLGHLPKENDWGIRALSGLDGLQLHLPRAKVLGGCSVVQGGIALRGFPEDFVAWAKAADDSWNFLSVLPVFRSIEYDVDFANEWHGREGPVRIVRASKQELQPLHFAFIDSAMQAGQPWCNDFNGSSWTGVGLVPSARRNGHRETVRDWYLNKKGAGSLTIRSHTLGRRVIFHKYNPVAVECVDANGEIEIFHGSEVFICAGAIGSPAILMRSGIGDPLDLRNRGIKVIHALPGVGRNLRDHPGFWIEFDLPQGRVSDHYWFPVMQRSIKTATSGSFAFALESFYDFRLSSSPLAYRKGIVWAVLLDTSGTGAVTLPVQNIDGVPDVTLAFDSPDNITMSKKLLRIACKLIFSSAYQKLGLTCPRLTTIARFGGSGPGLRAPFVSTDLFRPDSHGSNSQKELSTAFRFCTLSAHHLHGTCRIGLPTDYWAVTNASGLVHGFHNLFVADASVIPIPFRANTHLCTIMIAENLASRILERHTISRSPYCSLRE